MQSGGGCSGHGRFGRHPIGFEAKEPIMPISAPELGDILVRDGLIEPGTLIEILVEQADAKEQLGEVLLERGIITQEIFLDAVAKHLGYGRFDPNQNSVENEALELVPVEFARRHNVLPLNLDETRLHVAMTYPVDIEALDHLQGFAKEIHKEVQVVLAMPQELDEIRESAYSKIERTRNLSNIIDQVVSEVGGVSYGDEDPDEEEAARRAEDAGIVNLVDQVIAQALQERATDIHIEPQEHGLVIRFRVDGLLYDALKPPHAVYTGTISRIKILSNMDIAERRTAQDGRFTFRNGGQEVDIRVSSVPTVHGEKIVMRLLDKTNFNFSLRDLGLSEEDYQDFQKAIRHPFGMILLSGPTGSGKTTTLYSSLLELRDETLNITTIEDPVEYQMDRINQVQVNTRKDVSFSNALRAFLRQDPDVIMVGEVRDGETADISIRAALTGHLVFSTIHANDAPSTATRLVSMGSEPFMTASALTLVAAQRLIRRNCPHCLTEYQPADEVLLAVGDPGGTGAAGSKHRFLKGAGCPACKGRGYYGRVAIIEKMMLTPQLRQLVAESRPASEIREVAISQGMKTLKQNGLMKAMQGVTTPEEVLRVCLSDE